MKAFAFVEARALAKTEFALRRDWAGNSACGGGGRRLIFLASPMKPFSQHPLWPVTPVVTALLVLTGCGEKAKPQPKQYNVTPPTAAEEAETRSQPVSSPASPTAKVMSPADQKTIQERFVAPGTQWSKKSADEKRNAYYGWAQQYMFGDAATKTRVLAEIRKTGLSSDDLRDLRQLNQSLTFPPLPL